MACQTTIHYDRLSRVVDAEHPWLGLASFDEKTQEWFYGRDREIRDLFRRVREHPLTVLFGRSGLGKTSLLGAGLLPKLRVEGYRPVLLRLRLDADAPPLVDQVRFALWSATCVNSGGRQVPASTLVPETLWELFHHVPTRPTDVATSPPVIVFDQFEEVFTLATEPHRLAEQGRLATELADLVEHRPPESVQRRLLAEPPASRDYDFGPSPVRVVIALREDYLSLIEAWNKLMPAVMRNRMQLRELDGPQALEAVVKPGRRAGMDLVDDEVGGRIVRFVADRPADTPLEAIAAVPPLLSLVCDELNQARLAADLPAITAELVDHQSRDILSNFYERSFDGIPDIPLDRRDSSITVMAASGAAPTAREEVRRFVEDRLVTVGGHRTPVAREDAIDRLTSAGVPDPTAAIDHLVQGRLLTAEERDGLQRLEITHDVLADLVVRSRDDRRERERARRAEEALAAQRRRSRRQRLVTAALAVLALVSLAASGVAWMQTRRAHAALERVSRNDLESARNLLREKGQPEILVMGRPPQWSRGLALLVRAATSASSPEATRVLYGEVLDYIAEVGVRVPRLPPFHHPGATCIAFNGAGERLASGGADGSIKIWDVKTGTVDREDGKLNGPIHAMAFASDGTLLVAAVEQSTKETASPTVADGQRDRGSAGSRAGPPGRRAWIKVGDAEPRDIEGRIGARAVVAVDFSADGRRYAAVTETNVQVLTIAHEPVGKPIECKEPVAARLSPDGRFVAIVLADGNGLLRRVDPEGEDPPFAFPRGSGPETTAETNLTDIGDIAWLRSGDHVVVCDGGNVEMRKPFSPKWAKIKGGKAGSTAAISPDDLFAVVGEGAIAQIVPLNETTVPGGVWSWDVETGARTAILTGTTAPVTSFDFSRDRTRSAAATDDGTVTVRDGTSGPPLVSIPDAGSLVACSPDGTRIATARGDTVRVWDASSGALLTEVAIQRVPGASLTSVVFSADGRRLAASSTFDNSARVWDATTGDEILTLAGHTDWVRAVAFSPKGDTIATASDDRTARIWDAATGRQLGILRDHGGYVWCVAFSPDGRRIATGSDDGCRLWNVATWELLAFHRNPAPADEAVISVAFSPDGRLLAAASEAATRVLDLVDGRQIRELPGASSARFSPDGSRVVTVSKSRNIRTILQTRLGPDLVHDSPITRTAWSADGGSVATLDAKGTIRIWDPETRSPPVEVTTGDPFAAARRQVVGDRLSPATVDWVTAIGGIRFDEQGFDTIIPRDERERILRETVPDEAVWRQLAAWLTARGPDRTVAPFETTTVRQQALEDRDADADWSRWLIPEYDSACPGVRLRLASHSAEEGLQRLLRRIDVERLPDTFEDLVNAGELLVDVHYELAGLGVDSRRCAVVAAELAARAAALPGERSTAERASLTDLQRRAKRYAAAVAGDWSEEILALFREAATAEGAKPSIHHDLVWALLAAGRRDDAHAAWLAFTKAFAESSEAEILDELAWTGILIPTLPPSDVTRILAWARQAVELQPTSHMFLETLGAAELRAGDAAAAMDALERSRASQEDCTDWTLLHLAIARSQQGDGSAARQILADSVAVAEPMEKPWRDRLVWRLLRPEAVQAAAQSAEPMLVENSIGMKLVPIRAGQFTMGLDERDAEDRPFERPAHPAHRVRITRPFFVGRTEVTNAQWRQVMGAIPSTRKDEDLPVANVRWDDAVEFCRRLSELPEERRAGRAYRLPTEAEWEYACRAGTAARFSFGNDATVLPEYGWFDDNSGTQSHPVATKRPNPWGLLDMHGNVSEWCSDWFNQDFYATSPEADPENSDASGHSVRVIRGGDWTSTHEGCRSAVRCAMPPNIAHDSLGFRVVWELREPGASP